MNNTRIEILKGGSYIELRLENDVDIRYNSVINKIGKTNSREISGSNTFSIPYIHHNITALGLNEFNTNQLASALNQKYEAKYYNEDTLFQTGFVIINNMNGGKININFIDEALSITEKWGSMSYKDLLNDSTLLIPASYQTAIDEMVGYSMSKTTVLSHLTDVSTESFPIALFPNNLNQIGDKWQQYDNDTRIDDAFNPYQSRPIFNAKALMTLSCKAFGYDPVFHTSVDWDKIDVTYLATEGLGKNNEDSGGIQSVQHQNVSSSNPHYTFFNTQLFQIQSQVGFVFDSLTGLIPNNVSNFPTSPNSVSHDANQQNWFTKRSLFVPDVASGNVGTLTFTALYPIATFHSISIAYENTTGGDVITELYQISSETTSVELILDKSVFDTPTDANAGDVIGVYILGTNANGASSYQNMKVVETYLPEGLVSYDEQGQFLQDNVDLTYAASLDTVSSLMTGVMQKEGILMNIDSKSKEVEFFNYDAYSTRRDNGEYVDWSKFLQVYDVPKFNTNYGNNYAISNKIGLSNPYPGNTSKIVLGNQTTSSKYKDFAEDYVSAFSDVKSVQEILNTLAPFTEYSTEGKAMIEFDSDISGLTQTRYNRTTQGAINNLPKIYNVNYADVPSGVNAWYSLIDNSVRARPNFLLPLDEIKNLDLRKPIFIDDLGGFYIPEEIEQYQNSYSKVAVKLIKLESPVILPPAVESISLTSTVIAPDGTSNFVYTMRNVTTFYNYEPTSASIKAERLSDSLANGGTPTGFEYNSALTFGTYTSNQLIFSASLPITSGEEGYYRVTVTDNLSATSNVEEVYFGDASNIPGPPTIVNVYDYTASSATGEGSFTYSLTDFVTTPTTLTAVCQEVDNYLDQNNVGSSFNQTISPIVEDSVTSWTFTPAGGVGIYKIYLTTGSVSSTEYLHMIT